MRKVLLSFVLLGVGGCQTMMESPPANPQTVIGQRVGIMKGFVDALSASSAFAQGKGGAPAAQAKVATARAGAAKLEGLFPRGTALGDKGVTRSRALSTIFKSRSDFEAKLAASAQTLAALEGALARGSKADTTGALNRAKAACGSCHDKYRAADE
jgi:cytochrome c556